MLKPLYDTKLNALPVLDTQKHDELFSNEMQRVVNLFQNKGFLRAA